MLHSPVRSHKTLLSEICQEKQCCMLAVLTALLLYSGSEAEKLQSSSDGSFDAFKVQISLLNFVQLSSTKPLGTFALVQQLLH